MLKFYAMRILTWHFKHEKTGILIIRNDHLGDLLVSLSMIEQAAAIAHKNSLSVTVVTSKAGYELLHQCSFIDHLVVCDYSDLRAGIFSRIREYRKITRFYAGKTILLLSLGRSGESDYSALLPLSRNRYALETMDAWPIHPLSKTYRKSFFNFLYTRLIDYDKRFTIRENEAKFLSEVMGEPIYPETGNAALLGEFPPCQISGKPYFLVVPGSKGEKRQWPARRFAAVIDAVTEKYPAFSVVISGSKHDEAAALELMQQCRSRDKILNLCGKSDLRQLFSNVQNADFVITNDTGTLHVAGLFHKKCFCIGGNWYYGAYSPDPYYKSNVFLNVDTPCKYCFENCNDLIDGRYSCLMQVTADAVIDAVFQNIGQKR